MTCLNHFAKPACNLVLAAVLASSAVAATGGEASPQYPSRTPLVELIQRCIPSAVYFTVYNATDPTRTGMVPCGGTVIREDGYVLTCNLVANGPGNFVQLYKGKEVPYRVVSRLPAHDMALVKVDVDVPLTPVTFGRSDQLKLGESVLSIGNPSRWSHTISEGIINRLSAELRHRGLVQTSAGTNHGFEGSPMWNAQGEFIGQITRDAQMTRGGRLQEIGVARTVDRIREVFPQLIDAQERYGFRLGVDVDMMAPKATVLAVAQGSAAEAAGLRPGNVIVKVGEMPVRNGIEFHLALIDRKPGVPLPIGIDRGRKPKLFTVVPEAIPLQPAERVTGLANGLNYSAYPGEWNALPEFDRLEAARSGTTDTFALDVWTEGDEQFALRFTGYIHAPQPGAYRFYTSSDDGSRLWIGDQLIVDNDGMHGNIERSGSIRLEAGQHRIAVGYFQGPGAKSLAVSWEGPGILKQAIPSSALFVADDEATNWPRGCGCDASAGPGELR